AASTTQINLVWTIPLDQGVGVGTSSTESAGNIRNNQDANNFYRRGDVGVQVYRNVSTTISAWSGSSTSFNDTGLTPNTQYTYTLEARDNTSQSRGAWNNTTGQQGATAKYTLSTPPVAGDVASDTSNPAVINWTTTHFGTGSGKVSSYRYAFNQSATYAFAGTEPVWSSGTITTVPTSGGTWYLHVQGRNGDDVANGTLDTAVTAPTAPAITTSPSGQTACNAANATFTAGASGTSPSFAWYKHSNAGWANAWTVGASGGGVFLASSANNNNSEANCNSFSSAGDINITGNSWGLFGGSGGESISRSFPAALTSGQVFQIDMDNGGVDSGKQNGFSLQNGSGTLLMSFYFLGGQSNYKYFDSTGEHDSGIGFYRHGARVKVIVGPGSPASYSVLITLCSGTTAAFSGTLAATGGPAKVVLFNNNAAGGSVSDLYFNNMFAGNAYDNADNYSSFGNGQDKGDQAIGGATSSSYTTSSGSDQDQYFAVAYNTAGFARSSAATLRVEQSPLKWIGGNGTWDFSTSGLWQDANSVASLYCDSYRVLLDDSASVASPTVTLNTTVAPTSVTNNSTKNYTVSGTGKITGAAALMKLGSGTLALGTANDYTGDTRAGAGALTLNSALALQNSTLDMNTGDAGTVNLNNLSATLGGLKGSRDLALGSGTVSVGNNAQSTAYSGVLSGGGLTKIGAGTLTISGAITYIGATTVSAGTLALSGSG
ncbi:MAG: hypothetical protein DME25_15445, partial [Verrucomicrobia bacterium]